MNAINPGPVRTARFAKRLESTTEEAYLREENLPASASPAISRLWYRSYSARTADTCRALSSTWTAVDQDPPKMTI